MNLTRLNTLVRIDPWAAMFRIGLILTTTWASVFLAYSGPVQAQLCDLHVRCIMYGGTADYCDYFLPFDAGWTQTCVDFASLTRKTLCCEECQRANKEFDFHCPEITHPTPEEVAYTACVADSRTVLADSNLCGWNADCWYALTWLPCAARGMSGEFSTQEPRISAAQ